MKKLFLLFFVGLMMTIDVFGQMTTVLPSDGGTSGNGRSPSIAYRRIRAHYLIKASEMATSGFTGNVGQIGWSYSLAGTGGTAGLIIYMQNTSDVTNTKSTTWATAITGMTVVHNNASTTIPAGATPDITFTGGSAFTYTGGGVYVAFDWGCYGATTAATTTLCNSTGLVSGLSSAQLSTLCPGVPSTTTAASSFRPVTRFGPPIVPCTGTPAPGNTTLTAGTNPACSGASFTLGLQTFTPGSGVTYQWQSADDASFTVNLSNLGTASTQVTSQTAPKYYRCQVTCSGNTGTSTALQVTMNTDVCVCLVYCASTHASGCGTDAITRVKIPGTTLDNSSACSAGSYQFYNGGGTQTGTLTIGDPYTLQITFGTDPSQFSAFWIDYNNNGLFTDAGEFIATSAVSPGGGGTTSFSFTVSGAATVGTHRMRVIGGNDVAVGNTPCGASSDPYGETEDYCITLAAPVPCSGTPTPGTVTSNINAAFGSVCPGGSFTLSLSGTSIGSGLTYQWDSSPDNITYTPIGGATNSTYTTSIASATWFRCNVTCSGNTGTSTGLQISTSALACYCLGTTALAGCTYGLDIESVIVAGINNSTTCGGSLPYMYSNFDYISGNVEQGLSYTMTVGRSTFVNNACVFGVWVDWDNNNLFTDAGEYMAIFLTGGAGVGQQSNSGTLNVPVTAAAGPHRMRIRSNFSTDPGQASICSNYANPSEQEDYTLNVVVPCSGTPVAGSTAAFVSLACPSVPFTLYLNGIGTALNLTYQWESSPDNITYTPIPGATNSSVITSQQIATWYHCIVTCSNSALSATSTPLQMNNNTYANCICNSPVYSSVGCTGTTANDYIGQVTFAGINNTTGCGATSPNYQFFSGQVANVNQTVTYPITVSAPPAGSAFQRFKVYIDFNDNASFDDAGETVFNSGPISTSVNSASGNISIAANAPLGTHRLRVRSTNPLSTNIDANSCSDDGFLGEVEDYQVTISGPPPCTGTPNPGQTLASTPLACSSTSIILSLQNATSGTGVIYQWQSSVDAVFTTPVNMGTGSTQTATQSATRWYRCIVTCSGNNGTSTPVQVTSSVPCYCTNPVHGSDGCALGLYIDNFTFAGINNTSGCYSSVPYTTPFYSYFPNATATTDLGVSYPFSISTPITGAFTQWFGIYIDFNDNGSFDDAGELVAQTNPTISTAVNSFTGNILIPNTSAPGTHKMRIRSGNAAPINSCSAASSGETEDYNLIIQPPATSASSNTPVCTGSDLNLSALPNGATSYSWTGPNSYASSAQNPTISGVTSLEAGTYSCTMMIFGFPYVATTTVVVNPLPSVSASASAAFCEGTDDLDLTANAPTATAWLWSGPGTIVNGNTANASVLSAPASASGTYTVTVTDANSCSNSASTSATVYALPPVNVTVIGSTNLCTGQTTSDLQATGAVSYSWSTTETTSLITVSTLGNYIVTGTDANNCVNTDAQVITESAAPAAPIVSPAGPIVLCTDGFTTTSVNLQVTNYSSDLLWSTSETTQSINVDYSDFFSVTYTDINGCYSVSNSVITSVDDYSTAPVSATTTAPFNNICLGNTLTLSMNGGTLGDNAQWVWYDGGCGSGAPVATGANPTITPLTAGTHTYFVRSESVSCGNTACASVVVTVSPATALATVHYTASTGSGCNGSSFTFSVNPVPGAAFYNWSGTAGSLFNGAPGPVQTASNSVLVTFATPPPAGASGYSICAFAGNGCSSSNTICTWVRAKVSQPGVIGGSAFACASTNGSYSIAPVTGANTYTWTITGNAGINGGGATLTTTSNSITLNFGAGWTSGTLSVYTSLNCGFNSASRNLAISSIPPAPGIMAGPSYVCPNFGVAYAIPPVPGASTYNWTCSVPGAIVNPSGSSCTIDFPASIVGAHSVCVQAISSCGGASVNRCKGIANGIPNTPGAISGPTTGQCGQTGVSYSIAPVAQAASYLWTANNGATISGPNNLSGVTINFPPVFTNSTLTVVAVSSCGPGLPRTLVVNGAPALPGAITGNQSVCNGATESYSSTGSVGATSYNWTAPAGATILSTPPYSSLIVIQWGATGGNVVASAVNDCGTSGSRTLAVAVTCRQSQIADAMNSSVNVYPNPTSGKLSLSFSTTVSENVSMNISDLVGRSVFAGSIHAVEGTNVHEADLSSLAKGVYMIHLKGSNLNEVVKVTVE